MEGTATYLRGQYDLRMNKWTPKRIMMTGIWGLGSLAVVIGATLALEAFFAGPGSGASWPAAISAVSTAVLVVVTAVYVAITGRSVRLQGIAISEMRRQEEAQSVRRVLELVYPWQIKVTEVTRKFPLSETVAPSRETVSFSYETLITVAAEMRGIAAQLPQEFAAKTLRATVLVNRAVICCQLIVMSFTEAETKRLTQRLALVKSGGPQAMPKQETTITWDDVRSCFYLNEDRREVLRSGSNESLPEWADVSSGRIVVDAEEALEQLEEAMEKWLRRDGDT